MEGPTPLEIAHAQGIRGCDNRTGDSAIRYAQDWRNDTVKGNPGEVVYISIWGELEAIADTIIYGRRRAA